MGVIDVTMYQRGSTYIMSVKHGMKILNGGDYLGTAKNKTLKGLLIRIVCGG